MILNGVREGRLMSQGEESCGIAQSVSRVLQSNGGFRESRSLASSQDCIQAQWYLRLLDKGNHFE